MKRISLLTGAAVFIAALPIAQAADQEWYMGGGLGLGKNNYSSDFTVVPVVPTSIESSSRSAIAYKIFGGYSLNPNFAVEIAYLDLGKYQYRANDQAGGTLVDDVKISGFNFSLVGIYPISDTFSLLGKIGAFRSTTATNTTANATWLVNNAPWPNNGSQSSSRTSLSYGIGVGYALSQNVTMRGEYENFSEVGAFNPTTDAGSGRVTPSLWSLSAIYKF